MSDLEQPDPQTVRTTSLSRRKWPLLLRAVHFYASVFVAVMIAFYALSGFIATHADWFGISEHAEYTEHEKEVDTLPASVALNQAAVGAWVKTLLHDQAVVEFDETQAGVWWVHAKHKQQLLDVRIDKNSRVVDLNYLEQLDKDVPKDVKKLGNALASRYGGEIDPDTYYVDEDTQTLSFTLGSVWFEKQVTVFLNKRTVHVNEQAEPFLGSLVKLHRGEHSNGFQTFLADLTALSLLFVVFSGLVIGYQMKKRKRMTVLAFVVSCVLLVALVLAR